MGETPGTQTLFIINFLSNKMDCNHKTHLVLKAYLLILDYDKFVCILSDLIFWQGECFLGKTKYDTRKFLPDRTVVLLVLIYD